MTTYSYEVIKETGGKPIKSWTRGVAFQDEARTQLKNIAQLPFVYRWVAAMPDVHLGKGATIGSVIPTQGAIIPAAVGVDIGCGMMALGTSLQAADLPDNLLGLRSAIEAAVPHGRSHNGGPNDCGAWQEIPTAVAEVWQAMETEFKAIVAKHPRIARANTIQHLGTLGTGNHFIEVCLDESERVWFMLHSGSRGVGGRIGNYFIQQAKRDMERWFIHLPDRDLAYIPEGTNHFGDYMQAVHWAQSFARKNRELMMENIVAAARACIKRTFTIEAQAINCHHNYVAREDHFGQSVWVTRKGAVRAFKDDLGIIPGSMGTCSYIVQGKGNPDSYCSCSHGAGRAMSRNEARQRFTLDQHAAATRGVECRKDEGVLDETPAAYKPIDAVMQAQDSLVAVVHTLRQVVCVKG